MTMKILLEDSHGHVQSLVRAGAFWQPYKSKQWKKILSFPWQTRVRSASAKILKGSQIVPMLVKHLLAPRWYALHHLPGTVGFARVCILGHHSEVARPFQKPNWRQDATEHCFKHRCIPVTSTKPPPSLLQLWYRTFATQPVHVACS